LVSLFISSPRLVRKVVCRSLVDAK
jgi:hypothetical protein